MNTQNSHWPQDEWSHDGLYDWLDRKLQFGVEVFEAYEDAVINAAIEIKVGDLLSSLSTLLTRF